MAELYSGQRFKVGIESQDVGGVNPERIILRMAERPAQELERGRARSPLRACMHDTP